MSDACGADVENLGFECGHRTLQVVGKGNKPAGIPLVPRTAGTLDLAIGESVDRCSSSDGRRLDTRTAYRWVRSAANEPASIGRPTPPELRPPAADAVVAFVTNG